MKVMFKSKGVGDKGMNFHYEMPLTHVPSHSLLEGEFFLINLVSSLRILCLLNVKLRTLNIFFLKNTNKTPIQPVKRSGNQLRK